ncbi:2'-5'-oligoadenylate synthase 1 [Rhynchocyon petersi]
MARLSNTRDLDGFTESYLLPNTHFRNQIRRAVDVICTFLKERCFQSSSCPVRVLKVVKGGSSGKGTYLKDRSDVDLVVFLSDFSSFQNQLNRRGEFIAEIRRQLEACQREKQFDVVFEVHGKWMNPRALSFSLTSHLWEKEVKFDILPAFDVLGHVTTGYIPDHQIYVKLIEECSRGLEGEFSPCFTELQRDFLKQRPPKLKSLIRLVKHWYQVCKEKLEGPLPPQYALELLTVYAWECGSNKPDFNTAQGFRTVLELVRNYRQLCIYWTKYYNFENPTIRSYLLKQLQKPRPVILDPADPTGNVGKGDVRIWERLAQEATNSLNFPCFRNWTEFSVAPWDVPPAKDYWKDTCVFRIL